MPTPFDDFTERAFSDAQDVTGTQFKNRELCTDLTKTPNAAHWVFLLNNCIDFPFKKLMMRSMDEMGLFHMELAAFLKKEGCKEEIDCTELKKSLPDIIENYPSLLTLSSAEIIEKKMQDAFPGNSLKLYRGIPHLYNRDNPTESTVKKQFSHLPALKKVAVSKKVFRHYQNVDLSGAKLCLFTWVIADGLGDYMAVIEAMLILKERFPHLNIDIVALVPKRVAALPLPYRSSVHMISYDQEYPVSLLSEMVLNLLRAADFILQMPTFYPHTAALMQRIGGVLKMEMLGEYGFVESSWFHPRSGRYSMGLHGLEQGIFIRKPQPACIEELENVHLRALRKVDHRLYLAYLTTPIGGAIYLHALLKSLECDGGNIDICVPSLGWFVYFVQQQNQAGRPVLEAEFGVQCIEVHDLQQVYRLNIGKTGKIVRLLYPGPIAQKDFRTLLVCSEPFVAVRGDQSFSEAISAGKVFFYDGRDHARYFLKDLAALAENRLTAYPSAREVVRAARKSLLHHLPAAKGDWVEETFFEEKEAWTSIADRMGIALQDPQVVEGFQELGRILREEYTCNEFLCHLVQRGICHKRHPEIAEREKEELEAFALGAQSCDQLLSALEKIISEKT